MKEDKYMSFERKLLRNQIRANRGNKNTNHRGMDT